MKRCFLTVALALLGAAGLQAQQSEPPATRTLPERLNPPPLPPGATTPTPATPQVQPPSAPRLLQSPPITAPLPALPASILSWDADLKEYTTKPGEVQGHFTFFFTNVSSEPVSITSAAASCGCTVPKLPAQPWKIEPSASGEIPVTMNVAGKSGAVLKTVTINTDRGPKILTVKVNVTPPDPQAVPAAMRPMDRGKNVELAKADRQAIFKGDCASCHVEKGRGKFGKELYAASCGICHDAEHRAEMVPDLHNLKHDTNADYWKTWITLGKPGSLMPAFAQSQGGPMTELEINSLVQYLANTIPAQANRTAALK